MSDLNVIRAWKDAKYRRSLSAAELAQVPENPAGPVELTDSELRKAGGFGPSGDALQTVMASTPTFAGCCDQTTAATCTATFGGCCPEP